MKSERQSFDFHGERDLPQLGIRIPALTLFRFWAMLPHHHGGLWNAAEPARSLGLSQTTVRQYLDLMTQVFMVRQLPPWRANPAKRQVKAPKVYVRDTGEGDLQRHPKLGSSWEGYAIEETVKLIEPDEAYFWATHTGAELDLLLLKNGRRYGVEMKHQDAPRVTASMRIALEDLRLDHLTVLYPGSRDYALADRVRVVPLGALATGDPGAILPSLSRTRRQGTAGRRTRPG